MIETGSLASDTLPPIRFTMPPAKRVGRHQALQQLRRLTCVAAALALPALGIAYADTVHRAGGTRASQTAAPVVNPSDGAAVPSGATPPRRGPRTVRMAVGPANRPEVRA